jgi:hypothetical protein
MDKPLLQGPKPEEKADLTVDVQQCDATMLQVAKLSDKKNYQQQEIQ